MAQPIRLGTSSPANTLLRTIPLWSIIGTEVVAIAVFVILRARGVAFVPSTSVAVAVGVIGALLAVRAPSRISVYGRIVRRLAYIRRYRRTPVDPPIPFDLPQQDGTTIGARWAGDRLITVVRIARPVGPTALVATNSIVSTSELSLGVIAKALSQFDIELESIDVVAHGWRSRGAAHLTGPYTRLTATLPTLPQQDVWVVLRLNPLLCPDAIASRGGGSAGVIKTAMAATRRVANHLAHEGYRPSILTAHGISAMSAGLIDNAPVDNAAEGWSSVSYGTYSTTAYTLDRPLDADISTAIWTTPSAATTCAVRLTRDGRQFAMSTVIRYATIGDLALNPPDGLRRLDGRQRAALNRTLPVGRDDVPSLPVISLDLDALEAIRVADGGHGQLFGADPRGEAIAIPLFGSDVRRVDLYGSAFVAQQIVVRAIAVGARVIIKTDRPDVWRPLVANVNDGRTLYMSPSPIEQSNIAGIFSLCILDAREATEDPMVGTQLRIHRTAGVPERLDDTSDVALYQHSTDQNRVYIVTRSDTLAVSLVALPAESALIEGARPQRTPEPVGATGRTGRAPTTPQSPQTPPQQFQPRRPDSGPNGPGPGPGGPGPGAGPGGPGPGQGGGPWPAHAPGGPGGPPPQQRQGAAPRGYVPADARRPQPGSPPAPAPGPTPTPPGAGPANGRHNRHQRDD